MPLIPGTTKRVLAKFTMKHIFLSVIICLLAFSSAVPALAQQTTPSPWKRVGASTRPVFTADPIIIGGAATAQELRFLEPSGGGTNYTMLKTQSQAANATYTFPAALPSVNGQSLTATTAGLMSWATTITNPANNDGAVQFNDGGSFGGDSTKFFWDNVNKRLGIGLTDPSVALEVFGQIVDRGNQWTARSAAEANNWRGVAYGNGLFVAVSQSGTNRVMTSPDGVTWTARSATEANSWKSITYGNGLFVAISWSGTNRIMTSPDGVTWTARSATEANIWRGVTYGNGLFVAVSSSGTNRVMTSPDGVTWTARSATEANNWESVIYGNGLFVAVTGTGTNRVMTSPDGVTWTARSAAEANNWLSIFYGNGLFVAVAGTGTNRVMTSPDGVTWTVRSAAEVNTWDGIIYGNGVFVAVSQSGGVMTSGKPEINALIHNNTYQGGMNIFGNVGIGTITPDSMLEIATKSSTTQGLHIKGFASQTADLLILTDSTDAEMFSISATGLVTTAEFTTDTSSTAGDTRFFLYDVDNATLERVTVGVADSAGGGFKVLRIPN